MAKSILDIIIKLTKEGGADKETIKGLIQVKSALLDAAAVAGTFVAAGYAIAKAWQQTAGVAVEYANEVRGITQSTGLSAQESSKLLQVLDDMKISYDDLQKAVAKNADKFDYSIQGLAKMSDAYLALNSEQEKADFMQERFGKNWVKFVEVMQQGSKSLMAAGDGINKALILDDKALDAAREYEKNMDNINDSAMALKVTIGNGLIPPLNELVQHYTNISESLKENGYWYTLIHQFSIDDIADKKAQGEAVASSVTSYTAWAQALAKVPAAAADGAAALKEMGAANKEFLSTMGSYQSAEESYQNKSKELTQQRIDLEAEKNGLIAQGYGEQSTQIQEVNGKLAENNAAVQANAAEYELANKKIMLGYLERKLTADGTLDDNELNWLLQKGVAWGVYSQTVVDSTKRAVNEANAMLNSIPKEGTFTLHLQTEGNYSGAVATAGGVRRAGGTAGWETVPSGHPNDSFPVWMTTGESYAVIPAGGSGGNVSVANGAAPSGGGGAAPVIVNVSINTQVNTADREKTKAIMEPIVRDAIRSAQAQGVIGG